MSFGGPTKYCPRCNTLLPAQAMVCGTCGLQFSDPAGSQPASGYGSAGYGGSTVYGGNTAYGGSGTPGGWPQSQPQPGYGVGYPPQPGYGGYPAAVAAPPRKSNTGLIVTIVIVLLVAAGGIAGWFLYLNPSLCKGGPFFDRHGLESSVPLPSGCNFVSTKTLTTNNGQETDNLWLWTVNSPNDPPALNTFYTQSLPGNGWSQKVARSQGGESALIYCGNGQAMEVLLLKKAPKADFQLDADIDAPPGGAVLAIVITSSAQPVQEVCR